MPIGAGVELEELSRSPHAVLALMQSNGGLADAQHFHAGDPLRERRIEAGATLLDGAEMKSGAVGYDLNVIGVVEIAIVARDERAIDDGKRLLECGAEIGIICAAVANEPAGVHGIFEQVCEAADLFGSGGFAAGQSAELVEVNRLTGS